MNIDKTKQYDVLSMSSAPSIDPTTGETQIIGILGTSLNLGNDMIVIQNQFTKRNYQIAFTSSQATVSYNTNPYSSVIDYTNQGFQGSWYNLASAGYDTTPIDNCAGYANFTSAWGWSDGYMSYLDTYDDILAFFCCVAISFGPQPPQYNIMNSFTSAAEMLVTIITVELLNSPIDVVTITNSTSGQNMSFVNNVAFPTQLGETQYLLASTGGTITLQVDPINDPDFNITIEFQGIVDPALLPSGEHQSVVVTQCFSNCENSEIGDITVFNPGQINDGSIIGGAQQTLKAPGGWSTDMESNSALYSDYDSDDTCPPSVMPIAPQGMWTQEPNGDYLFFPSTLNISSENLTDLAVDQIQLLIFPLDEDIPSLTPPYNMTFSYPFPEGQSQVYKMLVDGLPWLVCIENQTTICICNYQQNAPLLNPSCQGIENTPSGIILGNYVVDQPTASYYNQFPNRMFYLDGQQQKIWSLNLASLIPSQYSLPHPIADLQNQPYTYQMQFTAKGLIAYCYQKKFGNKTWLHKPNFWL